MHLYTVSVWYLVSDENPTVLTQLIIKLCMHYLYLSIYMLKCFTSASASHLSVINLNVEMCNDV